MGDLTNARLYIALRRAQAKIVGYTTYPPGFLCEFYNRDTFVKYAEKLTYKFFPKAKDLQIRENIINLYRAFLVLAPILQKTPYTYKLDWTRGHFLSYLRFLTSNRIGRKYVRVRVIEREPDLDKLQINLNVLGIKDGKFIEILTGLFLQSYGLNALRGSLVNRIFDPVMFLNDRDGFELRRSNEFIKLEKKPFNGCIDIEKQYVEFWDYKIRRVKANKGMTLEIKIRDEEIKQFKEKIKGILKSHPSVSSKIALVNREVKAFTEKHRYTKDAYDQMIELHKWLRGRVSKIAATRKEIYQAVEIVKLWKERYYPNTVFRKNNFFWDPKEMTEEDYIYCFSPYREV
ncbi:hypothetical protein [Hippea alviniae]|uniref:hypothetical protein n=1 Tax=Hippea alviniae TaxID=1279027 RepID=UPI0003B3DAD0|nr:hypothetical protein [Hippea alviniae]